MGIKYDEEKRVILDSDGCDVTAEVAPAAIHWFLDKTFPGGLVDQLASVLGVESFETMVLIPHQGRIMCVRVSDGGACEDAQEDPAPEGPESPVFGPGDLC